MGFREEEEFRKKEAGKLKGGRGFDVKKETILLAMKEKQRDCFKHLGKLRILRTKATKKIEGKLGRNTQEMRRVMAEVRAGATVIRSKAKVKFKNKEVFLVKKYGVNKNTGTEALVELNRMDQLRYGGCRIFDSDYKWVTEDAREISVVSKPGRNVAIDEDEKNILKLGPKFCILAQLDEERFENELEQTIMKVKWENMGNEEKVRKKSLCDVAIECILDEEQLRECEEHEEIMEAKARMVYD